MEQNDATFASKNIGLWPELMRQSLTSLIGRLSSHLGVCRLPSIGEYRKRNNLQFIEACYERFLGRPSDLGGRGYFLQELANGASRLDVVENVVTSKEYQDLLMQRLFDRGALPDLRRLRPEPFTTGHLLSHPELVPVFAIQRPTDYDWLEEMIVECGYYDKMGPWVFGIDKDKQILAEMIGKFRPRSCLEIGCANGLVLELLSNEGVHVEGIEISHLALALSPRSVRRSIHFGDLLDLELAQNYDLVFGMDVFEHINPNKLPAYLQRCRDLITSGGYLVANIPAYGYDTVFGNAFPVYLKEWAMDQGAMGGDRPFGLLQVDEAGWPISGHLICASSVWWQAAFEAVGLRRETGIEQALQGRYGQYWREHTPARQSMFVFSKQGNDHQVAQVARGILSG